MKMTKTMQNVVLFAENFKETWCTPLKIGDLFFNRFGVDEDAAFEMLGLYQLRETSWKMADPEETDYENFEEERKDEETFDTDVFDLGVKKAAEYKADDLKTHFICAGEYYGWYIE